MLGRVPRRSSSAEKALWFRMHPSPKARSSIFLKNNMPQVGLMHPPPQCGFLDLALWFLADYRRDRNWHAVRKDKR